VDLRGTAKIACARAVTAFRARHQCVVPAAFMLQGIEDPNLLRPEFERRTKFKVLFIHAER